MGSTAQSNRQAHWQVSLLSKLSISPESASHAPFRTRKTKPYSLRRHPLNCEPPLGMLMERGFLTPSALHYVRSHGPVPKLDWSTHRITVGGSLKRPQTFSMNELVDTFESVTFPVTLTCAGNRRKEQNLVKKSVGFNWGASGLSNSYWTGVRLCDVLRHCGIGKPRDGARYVCFRGVQKELPQVQMQTNSTQPFSSRPAAFIRMQQSRPALQDLRFNASTRNG